MSFTIEVAPPPSLFSILPSYDDEPPKKEITPEIEHVPTNTTMESHTMGSSLYDYLHMKVHPDVSSQAWSKIIVRGYHSRTYPSRVMHIEKTDKLFNWQRPTSLIIDDVLDIQCFPGDDYIQHYANIISTYLLINGQDPDIVRYILPTPAEKLAPLIDSNLKDIGTVDIAILGYVQGLQSFVGDDWEGDGALDSELFSWQKITLP